ncbi:unnamed protein product [Sphagnum troendelagicum]|uniref:Dof-type domain-containing protein n=1 Tax=Sphagnum troendelagicum TaxID=128251 RepID=A0ABP0URN2_9BRYO
MMTTMMIGWGGGGGELFAQRALQAERRLKPPDQLVACPRCQSLNTKFCYYNNYSLTQPRHFCKNCRRYWTAGGTLRNVPVGGGCRKNKRTKHSSTTRHMRLSMHSSSSSSSSHIPQHQQHHISSSTTRDGLSQNQQSAASQKDNIVPHYDFAPDTNNFWSNNSNSSAWSQLDLHALHGLGGGGSSGRLL